MVSKCAVFIYQSHIYLSRNTYRPCQSGEKFRMFITITPQFSENIERAGNIKTASTALPFWVWISAALIFALLYPQLAGRYGTDVAINVLLYICLGLGLNVVVGLAGMLDLGYIAFYGVGAYTYAVLNVTYGLGFWVCLPLSALTACIAGCIVGYPTLRMRGDYLAIVTLGFGEIIRIILNNWMTLTNGPNGILGIKPIGIFLFF